MVIKFSPKKNLWPNSFTGQTFKEKLASVINTNFQTYPKIEDEGKCPTHSEANITLVPKADKDVTRKLQMNIPYEYRCKSPLQNSSKLNPAAYEKDYTLWSSGIYPEYKVDSTRLSIYTILIE